MIPLRANMGRLAAVLLIAASYAGTGVPCFSKTLWSDKNIYSSGESLQAGDIVAVNIEDISQLRFSLALADSASFSISSNPDATITGFLPRVASDKKVSSTGKTDVSGRGNLKITIGSRVVRRLPDGKYEIGGNREYSFNGAVSRFSVTGIIDPASVKGRAVDSRDIAEFRLVIRGVKEGAGVTVARPPLKENESASGALTEEEKQRIIVDYLNKMLQELTR